MYKITQDLVTDENGQTDTAFGIEYPEEDLYIPDVFLDRERAEEFVALCNKLDLSPLHIFDVLEDIL